MENTALSIENVSKIYQLGVIGTGTLKGDLESWWALKRGKEDPNLVIGTTRQLRKGSFYALDDVSFKVNRGEALGIIGRNGAGKSTLLKLITRITVPSAGRIVIAGRVSSMLEVGVGFHPEMTGRENIYLNGAILGMSRQEIDRKIDEIIDFSECGKFIDTPVKRYSSGMYVKLAFSVASHLDSEIVIMDEVLAVGDVAFQNKCLARMKGIAKNENKTVLYVSHNMSTIRRLCDRCLVLDKGKLVFDGDVERAISVYLGDDVNNSNAVTTVAHDELVDDGTPRLAVDSIELLEKKNNAYMPGEKLNFRLMFSKTQPFSKKLYLRTIIRAADDTPVGSSVSLPFELDSDSPQQAVSFSMDVSSLAPGAYYMLYDVFTRTSDVLQDYVNLFTVLEKVHFNISPQDVSTVWKHAYWGYNQFPAAEILENS